MTSQTKSETKSETNHWFENNIFLQYSKTKMESLTPQKFDRLYANPAHPNSSVEETCGTKEGHVFRDAESGKFYHFNNHMEASIWFYKLDRPQIHSCLSRDRPVRFNLELDMEVEKLDGIKLDEQQMKKIEGSGLNVNIVKAMLVVEHVKTKIMDVLEFHYQIEPSEYVFQEATDNRKSKYSHRLYLKLYFGTQNEYKHFIRLLKDEVRPDVFTMVDPTTSMLRTPGSWKDDHQCQWRTNDCFSESILTNIYNCDELMEIAPAEFKRDTDELTTDMERNIAGLVATHPDLRGNFILGKAKDNCITLKRVCPSFCICCQRTHDSIDAYCVVANGQVYFKCFRDKDNSVSLGDEVELHIGYVGETPAPIKISNWRDIKRALKTISAPTTGLSKKELALKQELAAEAKLTLAEKSGDNNKALEAIAAKRSFIFDDFKYIHGKTFPNMSMIDQYCEAVVVKICQGGNSFYISRSFWKNTQHFTELKNAPLMGVADSIQFEVSNPEFNPAEPVCPTNPLVLSKDLGKLMVDKMKTAFYKTVDFLPYLKPQEPNSEVFNLFEGFRFPYQEYKTEAARLDDEALIKPFLDHVLHKMCRGDQTLNKTILQWFAHIIQKPQEKAFAIIIQGLQGAGKSIVYEIFKRCIGEAFAIQFTKLGDLTQTHNKIVRGRLLVNCNEATNYPTEKDVNIMKAFITDTELLVNPKCCPLYYINNFARVLITTNCRFAMRLTPDDRRYCCIEIDNKDRNNEQYFAPLIDAQRDDAFLQALFNYFANIDISDFKPQRPPMTAFKREMIGEQLPDLVYFVQELCENDRDIDFAADEIYIRTADLYSSYKNWCAGNECKVMKKQSFTRELRERFGLSPKVHRIGERQDNVRISGYKFVRADMLTTFRSIMNDDTFNFNMADGQDDAPRQV